MLFWASGSEWTVSIMSILGDVSLALSCTHPFTSSQDEHPLTAIYFQNKDEFPEVEQFVEVTRSSTGLNLICTPDGFKGGIQAVVDSRPPEAQLAFVLGTRQGDPNAAGQVRFVVY